MIGKFTKVCTIGSVAIIFNNANIVVDGQVPHQPDSSRSPGATRPLQGLDQSKWSYGKLVLTFNILQHPC
jgi:hypothetical protein